MTRWIRKKDELPTVGDEVLGFDSFNGGLHLCIYDGKQTADEGEPWHGQPLIMPVSDFDDCHITHWMPLPDAPNVIEPEDSQ